MQDTIRVQGARVNNLKKYHRRNSARQARRTHGPLRLRQIIARVRHNLRRGPTPVCRVFVLLRQNVPRPDGQTRCRCDRRFVARHFHRPEDDQQKPPLHGRHRDGNLRLSAPFWARCGVPHCPKCGKEIQRQTVDQIVDQIMRLPEKTRFQILSPVVRGKKGEHTKIFEDARKGGYARACGSTAASTI